MNPLYRIIFCITLLGFLAPGRGQTEESHPKFLVVVSTQLYETGQVSSSLVQYQSDLLLQGWEAAIIKVSKNAHPLSDYICANEVALKNVIRSYYLRGYKGFVLIGSSKLLPTAWWKHRYSDTNETGDPCDLYYADMDDWLYKKGTVYVTYDAGNVFRGEKFYPEMFFGRICAGGISSSIMDEAEKTAKYLNKIHDYRINGRNLDSAQQKRALVFIYGNDYNRKVCYNWPENEICQNIKVYMELNATNCPNYLYELEKGYRFVMMGNHSGEVRGEMGVSTEMLRAITPKFNFINVFGCSACRYTSENLGAVYLFENDYALNAIGSTGGWSVHPDNSFHADLKNNIPVGTAFQSFIGRTIAYEEGWPKGVLLGDPLIQYPAEIHDKAPIVFSDFQNLMTTVATPLTIPINPTDPEGKKCEVTFTKLPPGASCQNNILRWNPPELCNDIALPFEYTVSDPEGNTYSEVFCIKVNPGNNTFLRNGNFESGVNKTLYGWHASPQVFNCWDSLSSGIDGSRSLCINNFVPGDAAVYQGVKLKPGVEYILEGWIRGENIVLHQGTTGACLSVDEGENFGYGWQTTWQLLSGTFDWTKVSMTFVPKGSGDMTIACRLGFFGSISSGKAWFDNFTLRQNGNTSDLSNPKEEKMLCIYPNPAKGLVMLSIADRKEEPVTLQLISSAGHCVWQKTYPPAARTSKIIEDFGHLPAGIYLVLLKSQTHTFGQKLILTR